MGHIAVNAKRRKIGIKPPIRPQPQSHQSLLLEAFLVATLFLLICFPLLYMLIGDGGAPRSGDYRINCNGPVPSWQRWQVSGMNASYREGNGRVYVNVFFPSKRWVTIKTLSLDDKALLCPKWTQGDYPYYYYYGSGR